MVVHKQKLLNIWHVFNWHFLSLLLKVMDVDDILLWQHFWQSHHSSSSWFLTQSYGHSSTRCGMCRTPVWASCIRCCRTWHQTTPLHRASIRRTTPTSYNTSSLSSPTVHILLVSMPLLHYWLLLPTLSAACVMFYLFSALTLLVGQQERHADITKSRFTNVHKFSSHLCGTSPRSWLP